MTTNGVLVTDEKETVIVEGLWTIDVPNGYRYLNNQNETACGTNGVPYVLQIQDGDSFNFENGYDANFNVTVSDLNATLDIDASFKREEARDAFEAAFVDAMNWREGEVSWPRIDDDYAVVLIKNGFFVDAFNWSFFVCINHENIYSGFITSDKEDVDSVISDLLSSISLV